MEGRVMALEQNARGLNARMCALERSFTPGQLPREARAGISSTNADQLAIIVKEDEDFVPATETCVACGQQEEWVGKAKNHDMPCISIPPRGDGKTLVTKPFHLDITGLAAGVILILISVLLYTDNMEMLKNPLMPFLFGMLLIICVCVRWYYH